MYKFLFQPFKLQAPFLPSSDTLYPHINILNIIIIFKIKLKGQLHFSWLYTRELTQLVTEESVFVRLTLFCGGFSWATNLISFFDFVVKQLLCAAVLTVSLFVLLVGESVGKRIFICSFFKYRLSTQKS